ncbi:MAG: MIP/aquaporin family protein [Propionicimonas sp.]
MTLGTIFLSEFVGSAILLLFGAGVVANNLLSKTKGHGGGVLHINWGWGIAVFAGVLASYKSGGHLNPAVTLALVAAGKKEFVPGIPVDAASIATYLSAQLLGAFVGAVLCWLVYKQHFDEDAPDGFKLGVFSTGPEIRNYGWNFVTEAIATFVFVTVILAAGHWGDSNTATPGGLGWLGALGVALLVVGVGASLGGPTGYAINPTRDLGPRIAHAVLPIPNKGSSDWAYAWVPVAGPIVGGVLAGLLSGVLLPA